MTPAHVDRNSLGAVVVTYHPDADFESRATLMAREAQMLVIVDNTCDPSVKHRLEAISRSVGTALIFNSSNLGLAGALNVGFALLTERGFARAIAFDQDSTPAPGFGIELLNSVSSAITGANWVEEARQGKASRHLCPASGFPLFFRRVLANRDRSDITCVIASGTLFDLAVWKKLEGFDESLFLDLVDTDYCLRARAAGHTVSVSARARLNHRRGAKQPVRFFGVTCWPAFMNPFRLRGLFRNRLVLFRRHGWRNPHWLLFELVYSTKIIGEIIFLEDRKFEKLSMCFRGTWEGLRAAFSAHDGSPAGERTPPPHPG